MSFCGTLNVILIHIHTYILIHVIQSRNGANITIISVLLLYYNISILLLLLLLLLLELLVRTELI